MTHTSASEFFQQVVGIYDDLIKKHVPCYEDLFWAMFYYLPPNFKPGHVLELGCGTGNLTSAIYQSWPQAEITAVDMVPEMLVKTRQKLADKPLQLVESSFQDLDFPPEKFDIILSSLALHHLPDKDKWPFFQKCYAWLKRDGFFVFADGAAGVSERLTQVHIDLWENLNIRDGFTPEELEQTRQHRNAHDHYASLPDLTTHLGKAGFKHVDVLWRYGIWAVLQAQK